VLELHFFFTEGVHASVYVVCKPFILKKKKPHRREFNEERESQPVVSKLGCGIRSWLAPFCFFCVKIGSVKIGCGSGGGCVGLLSPMAATTVLWPHHLRSKVWRGFRHGRIWCGRLIPKPCESETAHLKIAKFLKVTKFLKIANFL
jgi:hypothetical protein